MDAADILARNVVTTKYENVPAAVVEVTKKQIMDGVGIALAGSSASGIEQLVEIIKDWGGREESTILVYGGKVPAPNAAQVNASMAHARDFDDTHDLGVIHPSAVVVPTAIAMAERQHKVSGKELITAVALGIDLACRMALAAKPRNSNFIHGGWHPTALFGYFSAAATAGKILSLDEDKVVNALGIAYHQAAGNGQWKASGSLTKRMGPGFAARGGITAALMAEKGITGARGCLDGEVGIYNLYYEGVDINNLTSQIGERFEGINVSFKPYPCCRINHKSIDAVLEMVTQQDIEPEEVEEIEIITGTMSWRSLCQPLEIKRQPRNIVDAQFSLPWTVACAAVRRKVGLKEFTEEAIKDPSLLAMASRVTPVYDSDYQEKMDSPLNIKIKTERGEFVQETGAIYGSPEKPMTMEAITGKFRDCASIAIKPIPPKALEQVIEVVTELENVDDVSGIFQMLG